MPGIAIFREVIPQIEEMIHVFRIEGLTGLLLKIIRDVGQVVIGFVTACGHVNVVEISDARALAVSPGVLLMDEPLSALDEARKLEILPWLESLHEELAIPVLYVSHSRDEVARLADHLVLIRDGHASAFGPVGDMLTRLDLPLSTGGNAEAIIEARVAGHDPGYGLTWLDFPGGRFSVIHKELENGSPVRLRLLARDVSLTLEAQTGTSILNIFPATVDGLASDGEAQVVVRLLAGGVPLLARVTRKSADLLGLKPGKQLYAQAKSVAVLS